LRSSFSPRWGKGQTPIRSQNSSARTSNFQLLATKAPVQMEDGSIVPRVAGTPQGGVISPLLANLFLHYAFDAWMARMFAHIPFDRYADDIICHCNSAEEARVLWGAIADRFTVCKLVLHPQKTKIVYCKDANRQGDFPDIHFDFLGFQFRARKTMWLKSDRRIFAHSFQPAASPKALKRIGREIRGWALHHRSDKSLTDLAQMYNPCIRGPTHRNIIGAKSKIANAAVSPKSDQVF
jgi:RNA-directed DNA polymerase